MHQLLLKAAALAAPDHVADKRSFLLGALGIRKDGTMVTARNGAVTFSTTIKNYQMLPSSHAEGRLLRKLGYGGIMFVARVSRKDKSLAMARCCAMCQVRVKSFNVKKVYYTIDENHYGIFYPHNNTDRIFEV